MKNSKKIKAITNSQKRRKILIKKKTSKILKKKDVPLWEPYLKYGRPDGRQFRDRRLVGRVEESWRVIVDVGDAHYNRDRAHLPGGADGASELEDDVRKVVLVAVQRREELQILAIQDEDGGALGEHQVQRHLLERVAHHGQFRRRSRLVHLCAFHTIFF